MRVAIARLSWMSATSLSSPMRWRQQRAQHLVREVVHVLEDRQPRHQPRRQRRAAGRIRIDGSELLLEEAPVDRCCELHHWMIKVDDLVEPRPEEIALSGLPTFFRPHESPRSCPQAARESRPARRINLPENLSTTAATRQIRLLRTARKLQPIRGLGVLHGRLLTVPARVHASGDRLPLASAIYSRRAQPFNSGSRARVSTLNERPEDIVQVDPASEAEWQNEVGIAIFRQILGRKFPKIYARLQREFDDASDHRFCFVDDARRSEEPHPICQSDQVLFVAVECESVMDVRVQNQFGGAHDKVFIDTLPFGGLARDALQAVLETLRVDGCGERGAATN